MSAAGSFGLFSGFDHSTQEWNSYKSRLDQWFIANDVDDIKDKSKVKRRAILLSAFSEATYKLASNLVLPKRLEEVEFDDIIKILDEHFIPKKCGFAERFHFYSAVQRPGESHSMWAARVKGLAAHCSFKSLEEAVLDRFVMGMVAGHEKDKLFAQSLKDLTLSGAVELAESVRCAREAAAAASLGGTGAAPAAATSAGGAPVFSITNGEKCSVCGYNNHKADKCRFKSYKCKKCGKKGHLRRMCTSDKVQFVDEKSVGEGDDGESFFNIRCARGRPMTARVLVNGTSFTSQEFSTFCKLNGITQAFSSVYHPSSNGQAESFVKIIKKGLRGILISTTVSKIGQEKISKFLFDYRNSKNSTTGKSPAELLFGRTLRSRLDLLNPARVTPPSTDLIDHVARNQCSQAKHYRGKSRPKFELQDRVWIKKYLTNQKFIWTQGVISKKIGAVMYAVYLPEYNLEVNRHIDQLWPRSGKDVPISESQGHNWEPNIVPDIDSVTSTQPLPPVSAGDVTESADDMTSSTDNIDNREGTSGFEKPSETPTDADAHAQTNDASERSECDPTTSHQDTRSRRERVRVNYKPFF